MNINRNNYEEYFLLYADNELSKAERKMVEVFVKENPEFREEFCMLKLTINLPESDIKLDDKTFLFKNESSFLINKSNYEEIFVRFHDNELSEKEKLETEKFFAHHPELKSEFDLIGLAKLSPELSIAFPGKEKLYHREKSGKVIPMKMWRYVAAAVLVGFGLWISAPYFMNQSTKTPEIAQVNETKSSAPSVQNVTPPEPKKENSQVATIKENNETDNAILKTHHEKPVSKENRNHGIARSEVIVSHSSFTKDIQQLKSEPVEEIAMNSISKTIPDKNENYQKVIEVDAATPIQITEPEIQQNKAQVVSYTESSENNNYVFYDIPAEDFRKSKVGGFLKKVKRIVERTNPITRLLEGNNEPVVANKF